MLAEFVGTASLLLVVVGSGIMAENLSSDVGLQLLGNAVATGAALAALILAFGSVSGAHLNPAVSIADAFFGGITARVAASSQGAPTPQPWCRTMRRAKASCSAGGMASADCLPTPVVTP